MNPQQPIDHIAAFFTGKGAWDWMRGLPTKWLSYVTRNISPCQKKKKGKTPEK